MVFKLGFEGCIGVFSRVVNEGDSKGNSIYKGMEAYKGMVFSEIFRWLEW